MLCMDESWFASFCCFFVSAGEACESSNGFAPIMCNVICAGVILVCGGSALFSTSEEMHSVKAILLVVSLMDWLVRRVLEDIVLVVLDRVMIFGL